MRKKVLGAVAALSLVATCPAIAYAVGGREDVAKIATEIATAETEYMNSVDMSDIYSDSAFDKLQSVGEKYWDADSSQWKTDLSWIRGTGDLEFEWQGYADVSFVEETGRRAVWICREKDGNKIFGIVRGSIKDGKVTFMKYIATSRYADAMELEGSKQRIRSLIDVLSKTDPYTGRVPTDEERAAAAESRAKLREQHEKMESGAADSSDGSN